MKFDKKIVLKYYKTQETLYKTSLEKMNNYLRKYLIKKNKEVKKHIFWRKLYYFDPLLEECNRTIPSFNSRIFGLTKDSEKKDMWEWDCMIPDYPVLYYFINIEKPRWLVIASIHY